MSKLEKMLSKDCLNNSQSCGNYIFNKSSIIKEDSYNYYIYLVEFDFKEGCNDLVLKKIPKHMIKILKESMKV